MRLGVNSIIALSS